jgi:hypothetical protein
VRILLARRRGLKAPGDNIRGSSSNNSVSTTAMKNLFLTNILHRSILVVFGTYLEPLL